MKTVRIYLAAKGINAGGRQRAILLHCADSDIQDIAETNLTDTGADLNTLVSKFSKYFSSRNNVVFERYEFRQCIQGEDEDIDSWHTRLRMKANTCEFGDQLDSLIRDQIVACCRSSKLRLKLLQVANISLQDTLKTARSLETANRQAAAIENNNYGVGPSPELATLGSPNLTPAYFNPRRSQRPRRSGNEPEWAKREREITGNHTPLVIVVANSVIVLVRKLEAKHIAAVAKRTILPRRARAPPPLPRT